MSILRRICFSWYRGECHSQLLSDCEQCPRSGLHLRSSTSRITLWWLAVCLPLHKPLNSSRLINAVCKQGRASGFRAIITIFCQILEVISPSGKGKNREGVGHKPVLAASPAVLVKLLKDDQSLDEGTKSKLKQVFDRFQTLYEMSSVRSNHTKTGRKVKVNSAFDSAPDYLSERGVGHVKTFSPLELLGTAILLSVHMHTRTDQMLLGDIQELRHYLRENHKDLRINQLCWSSVWEYIDHVMIQRRGGKGAVLRRREGRHDEIVISDNDTENSVTRASTPEMDNEHSSPYFRMRDIVARYGYDGAQDSIDVEDRALRLPVRPSTVDSGASNSVLKRSREPAATMNSDSVESRHKKNRRR